jgi:hypothetical protein
MRILSASA